MLPTPEFAYALAANTFRADWMPAALHDGAQVENLARSPATRVPGAKFSVMPVFGVAYVGAVRSPIVGPNVRPASSEIWNVMPVVLRVPPLTHLNTTL